MSALAFAGPFVLLGALGSLHCAGMCGGFALLVARRPDGRWPAALARQACYALGKASTYALLALLLALGLGLAGAAAGAPREGGALGGTLGRALSLATAAVLVATGVATLAGRRMAPPRRLGGWLLAPARALRTLLGHAEALPPLARAFGIGVWNGFLPCGLSWGALLAAARLAPAQASLAALCFGLATAPALAAVGLASALAGQRWRRAVPALLGTSLVLFGIATAWRLPLAAGGAGASCCAAHGAPASECPAPREGARGGARVED